ncbi:hypothetical protein ACHAXR_005757, partial [Thalassiosira sp. AJA248-18]
PETTKLILSRVEENILFSVSIVILILCPLTWFLHHYILLSDWTSDSYDEDCYIDIRAYGKSERTREFVLDGMTQIQQAFAEHDLVANVRLETYEGERYFHVPPKK